MFRSLQILVLGISMLVPMAYGQLGSLGDYDGVLQAKFSLTISEFDETGADDEVHSFTLTSGSLIREYNLPDTARVFWVFDYDGPEILSGLVVADCVTGDIYSGLAEAAEISLDDFAGEDGELEPGDMGDRGMDEWLSAKYALDFEVDGLRFSMQALMRFHFIQERDFSLLTINSVAAPLGQGEFEDRTPLIITGGSISASGILVNPE